MCGRVAVKKGLDGLVLEHLGAEAATSDWAEPNPNLAPTDTIPGVRLREGGRIASRYLWGFLPPNAPGRAFISQYFTFNARADKLATGRLYASAFRNQRCLIPVSAWFEWPKAPGSKKGTACTILPTDRKMLVLAGLWGAWRDPATGVIHDTATVITVEPNGLIAERPHHRMPAILSKEAWATWLDPAAPQESLQALLGPCPEEWLEARSGGPSGFQVL